MNKNKDLLREYETVTKELESIRNEIITLKDITDIKMKNANSEDEKASIFVEFKGQIDRIKQDKTKKNQYKDLHKKKYQLEKQLLEEMKAKTKLQNVPATETSPINNQVSDEATPKSRTLSPVTDCDNLNDDLTVMINKYKKLIRKPIEYQHYSPKKTIHKIVNKKKKNNDNDIKQVKKLYNLIESLKMDIDK